MSNKLYSLPQQQLPFSKKTKEWRKMHLDWADNHTYSNSSLVRSDVTHKKINYDLFIGKLHMSDLQVLLEPDSYNTGEIPNRITHYPIINSKLNVLIGEESERVFEYRVVVTNPNSISKIEEDKKNRIFEELKALIENTALSEEDYNAQLEKLSDFSTYEYQDIRETNANSILNHYWKEYNLKALFNTGFIDELCVGEEIYQCDIVGGEPVIERLNPTKVRVYKSGFSNKIEDADMIVLEDYWSPGKIVDTYYDEIAKLSESDRKTVQRLLDGESVDTSYDEMDNIDPRDEFVNARFVGDEGIFLGSDSDINSLFKGPNIDSLSPYDMLGNIKVLRVYWKSRRKIKKVKSYDPETGEEVYDFYPENYIIDESKGEEETIYWVNQAWEGIKIGKDIYLGMRPKPIQYNSMTNPSKCHFGIIGTIYNINDNKPYSLIDMMKPYNYLYDVIHDRLNKAIAKNWGKIISLDLAKVPKDWDVKKWMYFAKTNGIAVVDSFNEGTEGAATGKIAGVLNNASNGIIDASDGNIIQQYINLLQFIPMELSDVVGISKQREGQISNRETVGGVERATLQSSHITERLFLLHDDTKKRVMECFLETAKMAFKGKSKKIPYIVSGMSSKFMEIDGNEFSESDYGIVIDNSNEMQSLKQKIDMLAQAALQNQAISFSTMMKLYSSCSLSEKIRTVEKNEQKIQEQQAQAQAQQQQLQQQQIEQQAQLEQAKLEQEYAIASERNETAILVAEINSQAEADRLALMNQDAEETYSEKDKAELAEKIRQFDAKLKLDYDKLDFDKNKTKKNQELKLKQINKPNKTSK